MEDKLWEHSDDAPNRMPLDELVKTVEFNMLTAKQKLCVATYISNGYDLEAAVMQAYDCKSKMSLAVMPSRFLSSFTVKMALLRHFGSDLKRDFLQTLVKDIIRGKITPAQVNAYELYAHVNGWMDAGFMKARQVAEQRGYPSDNTLRVRAHRAKKVFTEATRALERTEKLEKKAAAAAARRAKKNETSKEGFNFDLSSFKDKDEGE